MSQLSEPLDHRTYIRKIYIASIISLFVIAIPHIWAASLSKALFFFGFSFAFTLGYLLLKNLKNQYYARTWYIVIYWVGFTGYSIYTGGIWASALVLLILLPIISLGFTGGRKSIFVLALVCITYLLLYVLNDSSPNDLPSGRSLWIMITMIVTTAVSFLFVYFYWDLLALQTKKLLTSNEALTAKQDKLDKQVQLIKMQNEQITNDKLQLEIRNSKLEKYTESIIEIAHMEELHEGDFAYSIKVLLQSIKTLLGVDIVSICQYDEEKQELFLISQDGSFLPSKTAGTPRLKRTEFPTYFDHVSSGMIIQADDVHNNKYVFELIDDYYKKYGIASSLDCPYYVDAKFAGVIRCGSFEQRNWVPEDSIFVKGISHMAGVSLSALHKMTHIKNLEVNNLEMKQTHKELEQKVIDGDELLENLSHQISDYANINAHKIRGPVCRLLGLLELLEKSHSRDDVFQIKNYLTDNINELNGVTLEFGEKLNQIDVN